MRRVLRKSTLENPEPIWHDRFMMRFLSIFTCTLCIATEPVTYNRVIDRLGAERYQDRVTAKRALLNLAKANPVFMVDQFNARLVTEKDPEIRYNLEEVMGKCFRLPIARMPFMESSLRSGWWKLPKDLGRGTFRFMENGTLEYDSMTEPKDVLFFCHHMYHESNDEPCRLVVDAEVRILKNQTRHNESGMMITIEDQQFAYPLMINRGRIFFYDKAATQFPEYFFMDTSKTFHHYRYVIEGDQQFIYVDDMEKPRLVSARPVGKGRSWVAFGDNSEKASARVQVRKFGFTRQLITEGNAEP